MRLNFILQTLHYNDERVRLYMEINQGDAGLPRAYLDAAQITIANEDLARGRVFAEKVVQGWRIGYGSYSAEVIEYSKLMLNPEELPLYGILMEWNTSVDDIPQELSSLSNFIYVFMISLKDLFELSDRVQVCTAENHAKKLAMGVTKMLSL